MTIDEFFSEIAGIKFVVITMSSGRQLIRTMNDNLSPICAVATVKDKRRYNNTEIESAIKTLNLSPSDARDIISAADGTNVGRSTIWLRLIQSCVVPIRPSINELSSWE